MPPRRRTPVAEGAAALASVRAGVGDGGIGTIDAHGIDRQVLATAVRYLLEELAERHPGRTLEVRVPPYGAAQCVAGPVHRRGTPPNVIETDAHTWLALATGELTWPEALEQARVRASGERADLAGLLPLVP